MEEITGNEKIYAKANVVNRFIAKLIDALIAAAISKLIPPVGFFTAFLYILIADGFYEGQSIGKKLIGLRTILLTDEKRIGFKDSVIRNIPFAIAYVFFLIPYIGWLFSLLVIGLEAILIIGNEKGSRIGDEIAKTMVVDYNKDKE